MEIENILEITLFMAYTLVLISVLMILFFSIYQSLKKPKQAQKTIIVLLTLFSLFGVSWSVAGHDVTALYVELGINEGSSKMIGAALLGLYLLVGITVLLIFYVEIGPRLFKKKRV